VISARRHEELAQLELSGPLQLLHGRHKPRLQDGERVRTGMLEMVLGGTIIGGQEFLIGWPAGLVFN
jgi:hypothetical protein